MADSSTSTGTTSTSTSGSTTGTALTLADLVAAIDKDRRLAVEVLSKLPLLLQTNGDVNFALDPVITVPSIPKIQAALQTGGLSDITKRVSTSEDLIRGLIQQQGRLAAAINTTTTSPFWSPLDLTKTNSNGDTGNPIYRAQVNGRISFPYDGYQVVTMDRVSSTIGANIGGTLLPAYNEVLVNKYKTAYTEPFSSASAPPNWLDITNYPAFTKTVTYGQRYIYSYYYGYYYYWYWYRYYYYYPYYSYYYYDYTYTVTTTENLAASAVAQTFQVSQDRTCLGIRIACLTPGTTAAAATPTVYLAQTSAGAPLLSSVIVAGTYRADTNYSSTSTYGTMATIDFVRPVNLLAGTSYAIVFKANATWKLAYTANEDATGGIFYTQDGAYWQADLQKDFYYQLRCCDFGAGNTDIILNLNALSLSGGIASLFTTQVVDYPSNASIKVEIQINSAWSDVSILNSVNSLPPYTPARVHFLGNQYAMPLIDTTQSSITAFRPATALLFISLSRQVVTSGKVQVTYELTGFDATYHTWTPQIYVGTTGYTPDTLTTRTSTDGKVTTATAVYTIPTTATTFTHRIAGTTQTAVRMFDINSVIEINT